MNASSVRRLRALALVLSCGAAPISSALAADPADPVTQGPSEADRYFEQGVAARKADKQAEAEALFEKAWALKKTWDIAANLGFVKLKLGKMPEGADLVFYAWRELPPTEPDSMRHTLSQALLVARQEVGALDLHCDVRGAEVRFNGKLRGTTPIRETVFVAPGELTIEVHKDGYAPSKKTVHVEKHTQQRVELTLVKQEPPGERSKVPAFVMGGVGAASLVAGGVLLGLGLSERDSLRADAPKDAQGNSACSDTRPSTGANPACDDLRTRGQTANAMGQSGIALLFAGGALGAATAAYVLWPRADGSAKAAHVVPVVGPNGAALVWTGSF